MNANEAAADTVRPRVGRSHFVVEAMSLVDLRPWPAQT